VADAAGLRAGDIAGALQAAGLDPALATRGTAPSMFPEVLLEWGEERFVLRSREEVPLHASDMAAMEMQLEARALARRWGVAWKGGVGPEGARVAYEAEVPFPEGMPPEAAGAQLHEAAARVHVAHLLLRQRALQIARAHGVQRDLRDR